MIACAAESTAIQAESAVARRIAQELMLVISGIRTIGNGVKIWVRENL
jgi:hypothetical protein